MLFFIVNEVYSPIGLYNPIHSHFFRGSNPHNSDMIECLTIMIMYFEGFPVVGNAGLKSQPVHFQGYTEQ